MVRHCVCVSAAFRYDVRTAASVPPTIRHLDGLTAFFHEQRVRSDPYGPAASPRSASLPLTVRSLPRCVQRLRLERVHSTGLLAAPSLMDGSSAASPSSPSPRTLIRVEVAFERSSVDLSVPASSAAGAASPAPSSTAGEGEECGWRDTSLDAAASFGLMWGPVSDPLAELTLTALWPFFPEAAFTESAVYTDLDPMHAPDWHLRLHWADDGDGHHEGAGGIDQAQTPYAAALQALMEVASRARDVPSLTQVAGGDSGSAQQQQQQAETGSGARTTPPKRAGASASRSSSGSPPPSSSSPSALGAILAVQSSLAAHIESAQLAALYGETPSADYVDAVMRALMDIDADERRTKVPSSSSTEERNPRAASSSLDPPRALCPYGSLLSLLVVQLCRLHARGQLSVRSCAVLWLEFVNECRYHFEAGLDLPHLSTSSELPDYSACVVQQKLQTLQRCIQLQRQRRDHQEREQQQQQQRAAQPMDIDRVAATAASPELGSAPSDPLAEGWQTTDVRVVDCQDERPFSDADVDEGIEFDPKQQPRGVLHALGDERLLLSVVRARTGDAGAQSALYSASVCTTVCVSVSVFRAVSTVRCMSPCLSRRCRRRRTSWRRRRRCTRGWPTRSRRTRCGARRRSRHSARTWRPSRRPTRER